MQFHDNDNRETTGEFRPIGSDPAPQSFSSIVGVLLLAFAGVAGGALFYLSRETNQNHQLAAANQSLTDSLAQVRSQLQSVSQQVSDLNAVRAAEAAAKERAAQQRTAPQRIARSEAPAARPQQRDDPRFKQLQEQISTQGNQLADQQKQIETARGEIGRAHV